MPIAITPERPRARIRALLTTLLVLTSLLGLTTTASAQTAPEIRVLGNRADLVSDGDALVEVVLPSGTDASTVVMWLNTANVTSQFALRSNGRYMGVLDGLGIGSNELIAVIPGGLAASLTITNYPIEGPVFSGPHLSPWDCRTTNAGLGPADTNCNADSIYSYHYQSVTQPGTFQNYNTSSPPNPATVRQITTDHGNTVPYIVRRETGSMNRGIFTVAVLYDPTAPFEPWAQQPGWNGKLFYPFGASCGTNYNQGNAQGVLDDQALAKGFAVATSSLNELGHHCDTVKSAESVMMLKEHVTEDFGEIRYTFGEGLSGGSIGQLQVANAYPGLLQGLIPGLTYPDVWTTAMDVADCVLFNAYFDGAGATVYPDSASRMQAEGHGTPTVCRSWEALFGGNIYPETGCNAGNAPDYHPTNNPSGCRATVGDIQVNVWGRRSTDNFAKRPYTNDGVQFGFEGLNSGLLSIEQFLHLNENLGGADIDGNPTPTRTTALHGVSSIAYTAARIDDGKQLDQVAIIDLPSPENAEIHTAYHPFSIEARLVKAHGHGDNHAIWRGAAVDTAAAPAFDTMDAWLAAVEADGSSLPLAQKILTNRPATAEDSCFIGGAQVYDEAACDAAWPYYASTRIAAGSPFEKDIIQCALKTPDPADYSVTFSPAEWQRLLAAFPNGVCNWSQPGIGQAPSQPWVTYAGGPGGQPMGAAPVSVPEPGTAWALICGAALLAGLRRRSA